MRRLIVLTLLAPAFAIAMLFALWKSEDLPGMAP